MGERDPTFPKLPFLHIPPATTMGSPEHPSTPPLQTLASVPFKWEEQPGKPRPCTDVIPSPAPAKILELPPSKITKTPSPTMVLDGPQNLARPKFSSFRLFREDHEYNYCDSPDDQGVFLGSRRIGRGFFGKFRGGKRVFDGGSSRFSPSSVSGCDSTVKNNNNGGRNMKRNGSFSGVPHARTSHIWGTIYQGLKQVIQWKSNRKPNKQGHD